LAVSIVASGSRGAAVAACAGTVVFAFGTQSWRARAAFASGVAALAAASVVVTAVSSPLSPAQAAEVAKAHKYPVGSTEKRTPNDAEFMIRLEDEIGYSSGDSGHRTWVSSSGRIQAW